MEELRSLMRESQQDRGRLHEKVAEVEKDVGWILKAVRGDNGTGANGLLSRFIVMELRMADQAEELAKQDKKLDKILSLLDSRSAEDSKAKWTLLSAVLVALLTFLGQLFGAVLKHP